MSAFRQFGLSPVAVLTATETTDANGARAETWRVARTALARMQPETSGAAGGEIEVSNHPEGRRDDEGAVIVFLAAGEAVVPRRTGFLEPERRRRIYRVETVQPWGRYQRLRCRNVPGARLVYEAEQGPGRYVLHVPAIGDPRPVQWKRTAL